MDRCICWGHIQSNREGRKHVSSPHQFSFNNKCCSLIILLLSHLALWLVVHFLTLRLNTWGPAWLGSIRLMFCQVPNTLSVHSLISYIYSLIIGNVQCIMICKKILSTNLCLKNSFSLIGPFSLFSVGLVLLCYTSSVVRFIMFHFWVGREGSSRTESMSVQTTEK